MKNLTQHPDGEVQPDETDHAPWLPEGEDGAGTEAPGGVVSPETASQETASHEPESQETASQETASEAASPETGPPETGPPEAGPPETGPPETAQPATAPSDGVSASPERGAALFDLDATPDGAADTTSPAVHPRLWQRRMAVLGDQGRRRLRWIVAGVAVLVALCVTFLVLHTPLLAVRHATVEGATHTGSAAVLQAAGLTAHPPLIDVNPKTAGAQIEQLPWVKRAVVVRRWPDSVVVRVTERVPVGAFSLPGGRVALVDASGRVLSWESGPAPGVTVNAPAPVGEPGADVPAADRPGLAVAAALPSSIAHDVSAVAVDAHGNVTLTLAGRVTAVLGDATSLRQKLVALASVLAAGHVSSPSEINVTVPDEPTVGPAPPAPRTAPGGR